MPSCPQPLVSPAVISRISACRRERFHELGSDPFTIKVYVLWRDGARHRFSKAASVPPPRSDYQPERIHKSPNRSLPANFSVRPRETQLVKQCPHEIQAGGSWQIGRAHV